MYEFILYSYTLIFQNQSEDPTHQLEMHSYFCRNKKKVYNVFIDTSLRSLDFSSLISPG